MPSGVVNGGSANGSVRLGFAQTILQAAYAYAIPSPETLDWVKTFADGRTVVELGAGRGYWAQLLADQGVTRFRAAGPHREPVLFGYSWAACRVVPGGWA